MKVVFQGALEDFVAVVHFPISGVDVEGGGGDAGEKVGRDLSAEEFSPL